MSTATPAVGAAVAAPAASSISLRSVRSALRSAMQAYLQRHQRWIGEIDAEQALARAENRRPRRIAPVPPMGARVTVGVGKSTTAQQIATACNLPVVIVVPNHGLAQKYADEIPGARHYFGRQPQAEDGTTTEFTCFKIKAVEQAGDKNHRPAQSLCRTCPHGMAGALVKAEDPVKIELARRFFEDRDLNPADYSPCRFLYEGLPNSLAAEKLVMPIQSFSDAAGDWFERDAITGKPHRATQRMIVFDERVDLAHEVTISPADVSLWRDSLPKIQERLERRLQHLGGLANPSEADAEERQSAQGILNLAPEIDALFQHLIVAIAMGVMPDAKLIKEMDQKVRDAGASAAGTARWERVSWNHETDEFFTPLRALAALAWSLTANAARIKKNGLHCYEITPAVDWSTKRGSTIFLDATLSPAMRALITSAGGMIHDAKADQNMTVTRITGHLYARGKVGHKGYERSAKAYMREIEKIAMLMPANSAILTHRAYLAYADTVEDKAHPNRRIKAGEPEVTKAVFEASTGRKIGWFGKHDRGQDDWKGMHLAVIGMPLMGPETWASAYACARAAMLSTGAPGEDWPEFNGDEDDGKGNNGVPLPRQPQVRAWLLDDYAGTIAQAIGRNRAVSHEGEPLIVQLWGGIQSPEMDLALARHGVQIDAAMPNTIHRGGAHGPQRTDVDAIDQAIDMILASGGCVSQRSVRDALVNLRASARTDAINSRIKAMRAGGVIPPASKGGRRASATAPSCIEDTYMQLGAVVSHEESAVESNNKSQQNNKGRGKEKDQTSASATASATVGAVVTDPSLRDALPADEDWEWAADALAHELDRIAIEIEHELEHSGKMP
ncbi:hypothetical protein [Thiomonas sp.]